MFMKLSTQPLVGPSIIDGLWYLSSFEAIFRSALSPTWAATNSEINCVFTALQRYQNVRYYINTENRFIIIGITPQCQQEINHINTPTLRTLCATLDTRYPKRALGEVDVSGKSILLEMIDTITFALDPVRARYIVSMTRTEVEQYITGTPIEDLIQTPANMEVFVNKFNTWADSFTKSRGCSRRFLMKQLGVTYDVDEDI